MPGIDDDANPWSRVPVFGAIVEGCPYIVRPSAYALIADASARIAVVRTPRGCYLPGGGIDAGESAEQAVAREAAEECGLLVEACSRVGSAVEIVGSVSENACFEKRSIFIEARVVGNALSVEEDHELLWLQPAQALDVLAPASHRWCVKRWMKLKQ